MKKLPVESIEKILKEYGLAIFVAVFVALFLRFFLIEAYRVPSHAMKPTLEPGDTIFVAKYPFGVRFPWSDKVHFTIRAPERGEVIIFSPVNDPTREYIKRVVGLPGDWIEVKNGHVFINDKDLTQGVQKHELCGFENNGPIRYPVCWEPPILEDISKIRVPDEHLFVLGDLRSIPQDFKKIKPWGIIPMSSLRGSALWVWLSVQPNSPFPRIRFERMFRRIQ